MAQRRRRIYRLIQQSKQSSPEERDEAIRALADVTYYRRAIQKRQLDQVFSRLREALLSDQDETVRLSAAYVLTYWFQQRAFKLLLSVFENRAELPVIRGQCAEGIGNTFDPSQTLESVRTVAISALVSGLKESSAEIRFWSVYALGSMKATETKDEIAKLVTDREICPAMWAVGDEASDVLTYFATDIWPDRLFAPDENPTV